MHKRYPIILIINSDVSWGQLIRVDSLYFHVELNCIRGQLLSYIVRLKIRLALVCCRVLRSSECEEVTLSNN